MMVAPLPSPTLRGLGKNTDFAPKCKNEGRSELRSGTVNAFHLRAVGRELLQWYGPFVRPSWCGSRLGYKKLSVEVFRRPDRAYGRLGNLCLCGQSIVCPVCAPRIAAFRAAEVAAAFVRARELGFEAWLDTYTMPHEAGSSLGAEIDAFGEAWRGYMRHDGRRYGKVQLGNHTAREITFGDRNGWHYHHHQLRYLRPGAADEQLSRAAWFSALHSVERSSDAAWNRAFRTSLVTDQDGAGYVGKIASFVDAEACASGLEVAGGAYKGRNIVRLLGDYSRGDEEAGHIWREGVRDVCARKVASVRWSKFLRRKVGLERELTDEEVAADRAERSDELLGCLSVPQWKQVLSNQGEFALMLAAQDGVDAVNAYLGAMGAGEIYTDGLPEPACETTGRNTNADTETETGA